MSRPIRVGIIGANARGGWAGEAHIPAVQGLDGLELAAVATNRQETADEAAHVFGVDKAYGSGAELVADPAIDAVTIATRVPDHRTLVLAALAAGKHVYCEWPLGSGQSESEEMALAAAASPTRNAIGLQLRASPAVRRAQTELASGAIGRVLSFSVFSSTAGFGPDVADPFVYLEDPQTFANMVTIQGAHTLDLLIALGGPIAGLAATASRQFPEIKVGEEAVERRRVTFDHLLLQGRLDAGMPFALEVAGGRRAETPFYLDIVGETGRLRLDGGAPRGLQSGRIGILKNGKRLTVDEGEVAGMSDAATNVAALYAAFRDDIRAGTTTAPTFGHAAELTRLIEAAFSSSDQRRTFSAEEWQA